MFQAIKPKPDDARFHRLVFQENPGHQIKVYELTTITFGGKPTPAAAIVTLRHAVTEHAPDDEQLNKVVAEQFYIDYFNESVIDIKEALKLKSKLSETLQKSNFSIKKWRSNFEEVCDKTEDLYTTNVLCTI